MFIIYEGGGMGGGAGVGKVLRPIPLISITYNPNRNNKIATVGGVYDITLNGTLLDSEGSPIATGTGPTNITTTYHNSADPNNRPPSTNFDPLASILAKQNALRSLFNREGIRVELLDSKGNNPFLVFYPTLESINFEEGTYVNSCKYTINLQAPFLFDASDNILGPASFDNVRESGLMTSGYIMPSSKDGIINYFMPSSGQPLSTYLDNVGGLVEDFSETYSIDPEDGTGETKDPFTNSYETTRIYKLTRNISATGRTFYGPQIAQNGPSQPGQPPAKYEAIKQAIGFVRKHLQKTKYPFESYGSGIFNLGSLSGYNHFATENIDRSAGTYNLTETWILAASGTAYESYNVSLSTTNQTNVITINVDGTIKGLSSYDASGAPYNYNGTHSSTTNTAFDNALLRYFSVSNSGQFDLASWCYKRVQNKTGVAVNPVPLSITVGTNEFTGEITYNVEYDTRPANFISGVLSENISIQDTYPGDTFAVIPVLGRITGPVLQYLGSRTEYQRQVSLEIVVSGQYGAANNIREQVIRSKPILSSTTRQSIVSFFDAVSPRYEPGIRKYFLNPPQETWDPKEKRYSLTMTWVYEVDN